MRLTATATAAAVMWCDVCYVDAAANWTMYEVSQSVWCVSIKSANI